MSSSSAGVTMEGPVDAFAFYAQRLTAGREQSDVRAIPKQRVRELGARVEDVLAVVQQHEQVLLADGFDERADEGRPGSSGMASTFATVTATRSGS
jgi:hypothetical protein